MLGLVHRQAAITLPPGHNYPGISQLVKTLESLLFHKIQSRPSYRAKCRAEHFFFFGNRAILLNDVESAKRGQQSSTLCKMATTAATTTAETAETTICQICSDNSATSLEKIDAYIQERVVAAIDAEMKLRSLGNKRPAPPDQIIRFQDALGRKFSFPFALVKKWGVSSLLSRRTRPWM